MSIEQLTVTVCPTGKGWDASKSGYQIKACSAGMTADARNFLFRIGEHYGHAVYQGGGPKAALEAEEGWREKFNSRDPVPDAILHEFPVVWSYDLLPDDMVALTRVCYIGWTPPPDNMRLGNFFAHSLVFSAARLEALECNPLALVRSNLFRSGDPAPDTSLPTLPDLTCVPPGSDALSAALGAPYAEKLEAMISALCPAASPARPALVCLADWRHAAPLAEALLQALPPAQRVRTSFCTYETERSWLPPSQTGRRPTGVAAAHQLILSYAGDGRRLNLREDEYQGAFAVFNFVEGRSSTLPAPRLYAEFAAASLRDNRLDRLAEVHALIRLIGVQSDPNAWDTLVPAAGLRDAKTPPPNFADAVKSLTGLANQPAQAQAVLELLLPHLRSLARANNSEALAVLISDLAALIGRAGGQAAADVQELACQATKEGRARVASALLKVLGPGRDAALLDSVTRLMNEPPVAAASLLAADREQMVNLLLDALRLAQASPASAPLVPRLLRTCFEAAAGTGQAASVWGAVGESVVKPLIEADWSDETQSLAEALAAVASDQNLADASAYLNLKLLEKGKLDEPRLIAGLTAIARGGGAPADAKKRTEAAIRIARDRFAAQPERVAEVLGLMAEAGLFAASGDDLFAAYRGAQAEIKGRQHEVRRKLVNSGVTRLLCREVFQDLLPWRPAKSGAPDKPSSPEQWTTAWEPLLKSQPKVLDAARSEVARLLLEDGKDLDGKMALAERVLPDLRDKAPLEPGSVALLGALAQVLPLEPLSDKWRKLIPYLPAGLSREDSARLGILRFLGDIDDLSRKPTWRLAEFPHSRPEWRNMKELETADRRDVMRWCLETLSATGVTTPQDAEDLVQMLQMASERRADDVGRAVAILLENRDPVTRVLAATAFARCALEGARQNDWEEMTRAICDGFDGSAKRLFHDHLDHRFCRRDNAYERRREDLYRALDWSQPKAPAKPPAPAKSQAASAKPAAEEPDGPKGGLFGMVRGWLRKADEPDRPKGKDKE